MKTTLDYIKEAKAALGIQSDYALAKWLGITRHAVSGYQTGNRIIDDYTAAKIAEALGIDPLEVIAVANMEREKDEKRQAYWRKIFQHCAAACLCGFIVFSGTYAPRANAISDCFVYYVKS